MLEAQVFMRPAEDAYPPLHCPTQLAQSPLAESLALVHGLEWCHSHLKDMPLSISPFLN